MGLGAISLIMESLMTRILKCIHCIEAELTTQGQIFRSECKYLLVLYLNIHNFKL